MSQVVKVGIFATLALLVLGYLILKVEDLRLFGPEGHRVDAVFDSVAGLDDRSSVRVAGVRVGRVDGIRLDGRRARVGLLLEVPIALNRGTMAKISSLGLLGEKYIELIPGPEGAPALAADEALPGETPMGFDQAMEQLTGVGDSIRQVTSGISGGLGDGQALASLLDDIGDTAAAVRSLVEMNRGQVSSAVGNLERMSATLATELPRLADQLERVLTDVHGIMAENRDQLAGTLGNLEEVTGKMRVSVENLNQISTRIASGEGTLGKLIASDDAHDGLVSTLDSIQEGVGTLTDTLGRVRDLKLDLGLQSYWLDSVEETHNTFRLDIDPGKKRLYRVGLVDDPSGGDERTKLERITTTRADGTVKTELIETVSRDDDPVFTALFGFKTRRDARLWTGLIEDDFGVQVEYPLLDRRLWLSMEAFDFNRDDDLDPHFRFSTRWSFHPNFYLMGGYDDFLESSRDSFFVGGGVRWTDDDLKYLLGSVPRF